MNIAKVKNVKTPTRGTPGSAGLDFYVPENPEYQITLGPGESANIPSGIKANIPKGFALVAMNKSGVATKQGLQVGACVIDEDYQGEIHLHVVNISNSVTTVQPGQKLVQMLLIPVRYEEVVVVAESELFHEVSQRGEGGFGSTGLGTDVKYEVGQTVKLRKPYAANMSVFEVVTAFIGDGSKEDLLNNLDKLREI